MTRPFLKWAGGKYNILPKLKEYLPEGKRLVEPFSGAGSVFLNTDYKSYLVADANDDLINLFTILKEQGASFIKYCEKYFKPETNQSKKFYELRDKFNTSNNAKLRSALFIYLNRHGYNGLCRYNSSGIFNVPFGEYVCPELPIDRMHYFLERAKKATFVHQDFVTTLQQTKKGDVVYCDPPYVPLSKTANFSNYAQIRFDKEKQITLAETARETAARGIPVLISNHDTPLTRELYEGAEIHSFEVARTISSKGSRRVPVRELIAVF